MNGCYGFVAGPPLALLIVIVVLAAPGFLRAAEANPLPGPESSSAKIDVVVEAADLLGDIHVQAVQCLADGKPQEFVVAYAQLAKVYGAFAEHATRSMRSAGEAEAKLAVARFSLSELKKSPSVSSRVTVAPLSELRGKLLASLQTVRQRHGKAGNDSERKLALVEISDLLAQLEQLDGWLAVMTKDAPQDIPVDDLKGQMELLSQRLAREEQLLRLAAGLLSNVMGQATAQLERAFQMVVVDAELPHEQLARLRQTTGGVREALERIHNARQQGHDAAREMLRPGPEVPANADQVLQRADALLGLASNAKASVPSSSK